VHQPTDHQLRRQARSLHGGAGPVRIVILEWLAEAHVAEKSRLGCALALHERHEAGPSKLVRAAIGDRGLGRPDEVAPTEVIVHLLEYQVGDATGLDTC
jgi:hypothetical protein